MLFYDIEVFPHYWCVVVVDDETCTRHVFEDVQSLRDFYKEHRTDTWVGYNSRQYDMPMIKFIMLGLDPYECSFKLINMKVKWFQFGYNITELYKRIPFKNYDCILLNKGLKKLEGFRGSSIIECSLGWDLDRPLTREEKDDVVMYCTHDVLETRKIFKDMIAEYHAHESLITAFELDPSHFNKTKAQLSALILGAIQPQQPRFDEWDFEIADTIQIEKYKHVEEWYRSPKNHDYSAKLITEIAGVPHTFAWGGIHGATPRYSGEGIFIMSDIASMYPAIMIEYGFLSRNVLSPEKYKQIRDDRLVLKKNKDPRQLPYKIVLNGTFGASKDKYNGLYDPRQANSICVSGQLFILDLIEKIEPYVELVQSNTDGILVKCKDYETVEKYKEICKEWEIRTRLDLEHDEYRKVVQKDVNNYIIVPNGELHYPNGMPKWKVKGAWLKEYYKEDENKNFVQDYTEYDLVILKEALHNYFAMNIPVEDTIMNCTELIKFQKIVMISAKYDCGIHGHGIIEKKKVVGVNGKELNDKHLRIFASTNTEHGGIFKRHAVKKNLNKVSDTPKHAFILNDDIVGKSTEDFPLDKQYYIDIAKDRIKKCTGKAL